MIFKQKKIYLCTKRVKFNVLQAETDKRPELFFKSRGLKKKTL